MTRNDKYLTREFGFLLNTGLVRLDEQNKEIVLTAPIDERTLDEFEEVMNYWEGQNQ